MAVAAGRTHRGRPSSIRVPRPLSEPEARLAHALILRLRPRLTVWFHQPLAVTDQSGGDVALERRFAVISGLPLRRLPRYHGSVATWENHRLPGATAFVVELPAGPPRRRSWAATCVPCGPWPGWLPDGSLLVVSMKDHRLCAVARRQR